MNEIASVLVRHGYLVLFISVLARQAFLPVPTNLLVFGAGGLVGLGKLNPTATVVCLLTAFLVADIAWYEAGRKWGSRTLYLLSKAVRDPKPWIDSMVGIFNRHGLKVLLVSKFIIGLDSIVSRLSGITRVKRATFMLLDGAGALLWVITYMALGYVLRDRFELFVKYSKQFGAMAEVITIVVLLIFTLRRLIHWFRVVNQFKRAGLTHLKEGPWK
jgi:membrane protein DedA with SNARE-associated domain